MNPAFYETIGAVGRVEFTGLPSYFEECAGDSCHDNVHNGQGVNILRGLDPKKYTSLENVVLFAGLTCYIGDQRGYQDHKGNILSRPLLILA